MSEVIQARKKAQEKLIRAKLYRFMAIILGGGGLALAIYYYNTVIGGSPSKIFERPLLLLILFFPFLPAYLFEMRSLKMRSEAYTVLEPHYPKQGGTITSPPKEDSE